MRVVVAGAGFAGLNVARRLQDEADVTIVAPEEFVYVPLVHEILSEATTPPEVTVPLARAAPKARLVRDRVQRVEGNHAVTVAGARIPFDALVVAVGAEPNDYGVPGVRQNAIFFQTVRDALRGNGALKMAAAEAGGNPVRVVVCGASFTGVEVAGEAATLLDRLGAPRDVLLLDALPDIFPRQTARFRKEVRRALDRLHLRLRTGQRIVEVHQKEVRVASDVGTENVPADVVFWCAGVKPRTIDGVGPEVRPDLRSAARDDVYVMGDAARFPREMQVPLLAQTAEQQARIVAHNVLHPERTRTYRPHVRGLIVAVGDRYAVAELANGSVLSGELPWHVKRNLYKAKIAMT